MKNAKEARRAVKPILLIGPLPPPVGGARVSFQLFRQYMGERGVTAMTDFDLPVWSTSRRGVDHLRTSGRVLHALGMIPWSSKVVIFGSRGFCFSYGLAAVLIARVFRKEVYFRFFGGRPMLYLARFPRAIQLLVISGMKLSHRLVVQTETGKLEFPDSLRRKVYVVPGYRPRRESNPTNGSEKGVFRFVYTGAISPEKGTLLLVETFSRLVGKAMGGTSSAELHLFGDGPEEVLEEVRSVEGVQCHGQVENTALRGRLSEFDVFVFPSIYDNEGHPGSIIEALMAGLPVIASDRDVIREVVADGVNGLLVEPGNGEKLLQAMERIWHDPDLRSELSAGAISTSERFDADRVLPELARVVGIA